MGSMSSPLRRQKSDPPPLVTAGFIRGLGVLFGLVVAASGFFAPWTIGVIIIVLGVAVVAVSVLIAR